MDRVDVPRRQDLPGRRHPDQGRQDEHGGLARGARAAARPQAARVRRARALVAQAASRRQQVPAAPRARASRAARALRRPEARLHRADRRLAARSAQGDGHASCCSTAGSRIAASSKHAGRCATVGRASAGASRPSSPAVVARDAGAVVPPVRRRRATAPSPRRQSLRTACVESQESFRRSRCRRTTRHRVVAMRDVLAHRGPDDAGLYRRRPCGPRPPPAEHRRSGAAASSRSPNEDGTIWISFNGEIYNHARPAARARSAAATSTARAPIPRRIVHAYEQWGDACVEHLRGMFAFAIWDAPPAPAAARARSAGRQAALLGAARRAGCSSRRRSRRILASGWSPPAPNEAAIPELLGTRSLCRRRDDVRGHPQASARTRPDVRARRGRTAGATGTCPSASRDAGASARAVATTSRRFRAAARGVDSAAPDERRAARRVPVGRHRQQRDRGADGAR